MSYKNFIPEIWANELERDLETKCVFAEDCNRKYEGKVKQIGDSVRILGTASPTIFDTTNRKIVLGEVEQVEDTSITMPIEQIAYYNYGIDDIDKRQAVGGIMDALSKETSEGLANKMDKYIANMALRNDAILHSKTAVKIDESNILKEIDKAIEMLYTNDVSPSTKITMTVPPRLYFILKRAYTDLDTNNSEMLKNGKVGRYGNVVVKMSNNVATNATGTEDKIMLRTDRAIAFVNPMTHIEAFRPEKTFTDAIKGFILYDAKIVRPKELVVINAKYV